MGFRKGARYGTMINEGAAKASLSRRAITASRRTSFAQNKPLELLTGENLIYMLKQYADVDAKVEFADDWNEPVFDPPDASETLPERAADLKV